MERKYVPGHERLAQLPVVFTSKEVMDLFGWDSDHFHVMCARWRDQGLVATAGPRDGKVSVYYNRRIDPDAHISCLPEAIRLVCPNAIVIGATALAHADATTQRPQVIEVACPAGVAPVKLTGVKWCPRSPAWYRQMQKNLHPASRGYLGRLPTLLPHWALADCWVGHDDGTWRADPDDIDAAGFRPTDLIHACRVLEVGEDKLRYVLENLDFEEPPVPDMDAPPAAREYGVQP